MGAAGCRGDAGEDAGEEAEDQAQGGLWEEGQHVALGVVFEQDYCGEAGKAAQHDCADWVEEDVGDRGDYYAALN